MPESIVGMDGNWLQESDVCDLPDPIHVPGEPGKCWRRRQSGALAGPGPRQPHPVQQSSQAASSLIVWPTQPLPSQAASSLTVWPTQPLPSQRQGCHPTPQAQRRTPGVGTM